MPAPPSMRKVNPAESSIFQLTVTSPTLPLSRRQRIRRDDHRALDLLDRRRRQGRHLRTGASGRAHPARSRRACRRAASASIRSPTRSATPTSISPTGQLDGPSRSAIIQTEGQLTKAAEYRPQIIAYRGRRAGAHRRRRATSSTASRTTRLSAPGNGQPGVTLAVNRQPGANTIAVVDAHQGDTSRHPRAIAAVDRAWRSRSTAARSIRALGQRRADDASDRRHAGRRRDLPLPAHGVGDVHSLDRAPDHHRRHLRRHGHVRATAWTISR